MSSSSKLARAPETAVRPFPYSEAMGKAGLLNSIASLPEESIDLHAAEAMREAARREGEARAKAAFEQQLEQARDNIRSAIAGFTRERQAYYQKVESEVVALAISIARKILHRETQVDPFFLAGLVRVALDKMEHSTTVTVRVHPDHAGDCRSFFARNLDPQDVPEVIEDSSVPLEHTVLETELGTTQLGIEPQLKEIELGLMDLLAQRPTTG
jgi:flagellar assembly protein FliH